MNYISDHIDKDIERLMNAESLPMGGREVPDFDKFGVYENLSEGIRRSERRSIGTICKWACAIALVLLNVGYLAYQSFDFSKPEYKEICALRGERLVVLLEDGTRVWLNADSKLVYPEKFARNKREVTLVGEAYFRVAKDKARPFIIHTRSMTTEVLGTEFNLRAYPDAETHVTLVEGSVKIQMPDIRHEVILRPGENVAYADSTYEVTRVNTRYCAMWKDGGLYFDNVPLKDILHDLGRHYNLTIRIDDDPALMQRRLHFVVDRDETVEEVIDNLNLFGYMSVSKNGQTITIQRKN